MSLLTNHEVRTGQLISSSDLKSIIKNLEGERSVNPTIPPMCEDGGTSGTLTASASYIYSYSYITWSVTNGVFTILEETAASSTTTFTTPAGSNNKQVTVWIAPPTYGASNGVILYRQDPGDTDAVLGKAVTIITDLTQESYTDGLATASRGKSPLSISLYDVNMPFTGSGQVGRTLPIPFKISTTNLITAQITSGSSLTFDRNEDFLLYSVAYPTNASNNAPISVQTINNSYSIWTHEQVPSAAGSMFTHPVPIPYTETGIKTSSGTIGILGSYTGKNRSYSSDTGTVKIFVDKIEGPYTSPRYKWTCPVGCRAIVVHACNQNTNILALKNNTKLLTMVLSADTETKKLNSNTTYSGSNWGLPPARITSPSTSYAGSTYGNWNRVNINPFIQPLIMEQGESITTLENEQATIFGYVIKYE